MGLGYAVRDFQSAAKLRANLRPAQTAVLGLIFLVLAACDVPQIDRPVVKWGVPRACKEQSKLHLAELGIPAAAIGEITIRTDEASGRGSSRVRGHQAWARLNSCQGHVVLNLYRECGLKSARVTGDCQVPALSVR